jgi:hypothetical protein
MKEPGPSVSVQSCNFFFLCEFAKYNSPLGAADQRGQPPSESQDPPNSCNDVLQILEELCQAIDR